MPNVRIIAKGQRGEQLTKLKVNFTPEQSSTPSLMPETNTVYLRRATEGTGELMELVGGSVAWNQLVQNGNFADTTGWSAFSPNHSSISASGNVLTLTHTATNNRPYGVTTSVNITSGHKYRVKFKFTKKIDDTDADAKILSVRFSGGTDQTIQLATGVLQNDVVSVDTVITATSANTTMFIGFVGNVATASTGEAIFTLKAVNVTDLTQMFGSTIADYVYSLEQAAAGSGIAWLKSYDLIDDAYHAYSAPTMQSVEATSHVTVGKNAFDIDRTVDVPSPSGLIVSPRVMSTDKFYVGLRADNYYYPNYIANYSVSDGVVKVTTGTNNAYGVAFPVKCDPDTQYTLSCSKDNANMSVGCYDADWNFVSRLVSLKSYASATFTTPSNAKYITLIFSSIVLMEEGTITNIQLERGSSATTYEPYVKHTYPLDSDLVLRGIPKLSNGNLYYDGDTYEWDGTVTRNYGTRAYQAGDESLTDAITDGTNTVYKLTTPTTESADPFTAVQTVEDGGTEEFVTTNGVPVGVVGRFANAVPMEGVDSFTVTADDGTTHTYPVTLSEEIYRGYVDMLTGEAVSDMASIAEYNGETISEPWLSSLDVYSAGATPTNGAQVVYPITPEEVTATITGDPTELGDVTSVTSTKGTAEWSAMAPLDGKCIVRVVS